MQTAREIARELATIMACNCDLDNWQPEPSVGHSHVCRIYKATLAKLREAVQLTRQQANNG